MKQPFYTVSIKSLVCEGGSAPCLDLLILRKYPVQYMETGHNGRVFRTLSEESNACKEYAKNYDSIYSKLKQKHTESMSKPSIDTSIYEKDSIEWLYQKYNNSKDVREFMGSLSISDRNQLEMHVENVNRRLMESIEDTINDEIQVSNSQFTH